MPFFKQDFFQFFKSKTNWAALASLGIGLYMLAQGDTSMSYVLITQAMAALGIRDAIAAKV